MTTVTDRPCECGHHHDTPPEQHHDDCHCCVCVAIDHLDHQ